MAAVAEAAVAFGLAQAAYAAPSSAHSKPTPASLSVNANVALALEPTGSRGVCVSVGFGGATVSMRHL